MAILVGVLTGSDTAKEVWVRRRMAVVAAVVLLLTARGQPLLAQADDAPRETYARRGMIIGAATGGVLSGLGLGYLASGLCESAQGCDGAFREGFTIGFVAGGVAGGLAGLVIGAAIPRGPEAGATPGDPVPPGPWQVRLSGGPRWSGPGEVEGAGAWAGLAVMRPTTPLVRWGMEAFYLAGDRRTSTFTIRDRDGSETLMRDDRNRDLWTVSLVATRSFRPRAEEGFYLLASAGVYPLQEELAIGPRDPAPGPGPLSLSESSMEAYPGVGLGGGGVWAVAGRWGLGLEGRVHVVIGAGDGLGLPVATLGGSVLLSF